MWALQLGIPFWVNLKTIVPWDWAIPAGLALLTVVWVSFVLWWRGRIARRARAAGYLLCPECAYDLKALALPAPCPECGHRCEEYEVTSAWREALNEVVPVRGPLKK